MYTRLQRSFQNQELLQRILSNICSESANPILNEAGMCLLTKRKRCETMFVAVMHSFSIMQCRQRYIPLVSRCCQRGGEARLSRRAHNPQSGFHFCKIAGGRKFKSTPRYYFFQTGILSFQCRTSVMALSDACVLWVLGCIIQF